jgi:hypothetical protein
MRRIILPIVFVAAAIWFVEPRLAAQKTGQVFIKLVDAKGAAVSDLQPNEVAITEGGVACKTVKVEPVDWPIKLHVLVDNGKGNTNPINPLRDGLQGLFEAMPEGIEMSLYTTSPQPRPIVKASTEKAALVKAIPLIAPDGGAGAFFDALFEAATRIDKDKTPNFPVILMAGSDFGRVNVNDRDFMKLQELILKHAITVHIIVMGGNGGTTSSGGGAQTEIGLALTKLSGGKYENITTATRLATLLPELGKRIAESAAKQRNQFRVTYEHAANLKPGMQIGATVMKEGTPILTLDGHMP